MTDKADLYIYVLKTGSKQPKKLKVKKLLKVLLEKMREVNLK